MRQWQFSASVGVAAIIVLLISSCDLTSESEVRYLGQSWSFGNGVVMSYAELNDDNVPSAIGMIYSKGALEGMPTAASDQHHCFDRDSNGSVERDTECFMSHEAVIPLPDEEVFISFYE